MARRRRGRSWWDVDARPPEPSPSRASLRDRLGRDPSPVRGEGRSIAQTFWGKAWCRNLERYGDYSNRLPRGRTYVRSGAVRDVAIERGVVRALVMGSSLYEVRVEIGAVKKQTWSRLVKRCAGQLASMVELLEGRLSAEIMTAVTQAGDGLFPEPKEIRFQCSCPDWASMCKHVAAVLYGVGVRFDERPELLFELRAADPAKLVGSAATLPGDFGSERVLTGSLGEIFGVTIDDEAAARPRSSERRKRTAKPSPSKATTRRSSGARGRKARRSEATTVSRGELLACGVPASTIGGWLRRGVLLSTDTAGRYRLTRDARDRLRAYGA